MVEFDNILTGRRSRFTPKAPAPPAAPEPAAVRHDEMSQALEQLRADVRDIVAELAALAARKPPKAQVLPDAAQVERITERFQARLERLGGRMERQTERLAEAEAEVAKLRGVLEERTHERDKAREDKAVMSTRLSQALTALSTKAPPPPPPTYDMEVAQKDESGRPVKIRLTPAKSP